jgi:hypothetical protein
MLFARLVVKILPVVYGTRRFVLGFNTARHWDNSWARWLQSTPSHRISLRTILISSYPLLFLPGGLSLKFSWRFECITHLSLACYMFHPSIVDFTGQILFIEECKLWNFSLSSYIRHPITSRLWTYGILNAACSVGCLLIFRRNPLIPSSGRDSTFLRNVGNYPPKDVPNIYQTTRHNVRPQVEATCSFEIFLYFYQTTRLQLEAVSSS